MLLQKGLHFLLGALDTALLEVSPRCMLVRPLTSRDKMEGGLLVKFLGLGFSIAALPPEFFLPTPLIIDLYLACFKRLYIYSYML